jgi:anti-anti-sigma factor
MRIDERRLQGTRVLDLHGVLTGPDASELLLATIRGVMRGGPQPVVLHLADVPSIDAAGLGALVGAYGVVKQRGGTLKLARVAPRVYTLLVVCRLAPEFETFDSVEEALATASRPEPGVSATAPRAAQLTQTSLDVIQRFLQHA